MDKQMIKANWCGISGQLQQKYSYLTKEDLLYENGKDEELRERLQNKLGTNKEFIRNLLKKNEQGVIMKISRLFMIGALMLLILSFVISCKKSSNQKVIDAQANAIEAQQDANTAVAENAAWKDWQNFKSEVEAIIAANDKTIAIYKTRMTETNGKLKASYDRKIDTLELRNKELKAKLAAYKDDGKTSWEIFANEFKRDLDELGVALKGFVVD